MVPAQIAITILTVAAFGLSAIGLMGARRHAQLGVARMESERALRKSFQNDLHAQQAVAQDEPDREKAQAIRDGANAAWVDAHVRAGLEPWSFTAVNDGREFLAERIIQELDTWSRADVWLVGIGLLCGLTAGIWDIWLR